MRTVNFYEIDFKKSVSWGGAWGTGKGDHFNVVLIVLLFLNVYSLSFSTQLTGELERYEKPAGHLTNIGYTMLGFADIQKSTSSSHLMGHMANWFRNVM